MLENVLRKYGTCGELHIMAFDKNSEGLVRQILIDEKHAQKLIEIFDIQSEESFYCYGFDIEEQHLGELSKAGITDENLDLEEYYYQFSAVHPMYEDTKLGC